MFSYFSALFLCYSDSFRYFLLHYSHWVLFSTSFPYWQKLHKILIRIYVALSYDLQQLPKNKVHKNCERLNFLIIEMCGAYMTSFICLPKANYQLFFCCFHCYCFREFYYLFYWHFFRWNWNICFIWQRQCCCRGNSLVQRKFEDINIWFRCL